MFEPGELATDERGYRPDSGRLSGLSRKSRRLWRYGWKPKPERYSRAYKAIRRIHALCEKAGVQYVMVHLPEHPKMFGNPVGEALWKDYKQRIRDFAAREGIVYVDVTNGDLSVFANDDYYSDYHHMRPKGARLFSRKLGDALAHLISAAPR
jgi:lysophospholipase L1-like esterase